MKDIDCWTLWLKKNSKEIEKTLKRAHYQVYSSPIITLDQCVSQVASSWIRESPMFSKNGRDWTKTICLDEIFNFYGSGKKSLHRSCEFVTTVANLFNLTNKETTFDEYTRFVSTTMDHDNDNGNDNGNDNDNDGTDDDDDAGEEDEEEVETINKFHHRTQKSKIKIINKRNDDRDISIRENDQRKDQLAYPRKTKAKTTAKDKPKAKTKAKTKAKMNDRPSSDKEFHEKDCMHLRDAHNNENHGRYKMHTILFVEFFIG